MTIDSLPLAVPQGRLRQASWPIRLWIYQRERFPLLRHGLLIVVFGGAAVIYAARLAAGQPRPAPLLAAWLSSFCSFLLLRVADECKDHDDDRRHRPYLPVPRGLVSLAELRRLAGVAVGLQLLVALAWPGVWPAQLLLWGYLALMTCEFGCRRWLRAHPLVYVLSHMPIVPLIALHAMAFVGPPTARGGAGLLLFLLACFSNGIVLELARKYRWPGTEEPGVATYSDLLGRPLAVGLWLLGLLISAALVLAAAGSIGTAALVLPLLAVALLLVLGLAWRQLAAPQASGGLPASPPRSGPLETPAAVWILASYLLLGWLPLLQGSG